MERSHLGISEEFEALQRSLAGRYTIEREIGRGGMGIVFLARDLSLDRVVAIKMLPPRVAAQSARRERFLREARLAAGLSHPNIVPIHAVEEKADVVLFVMGFVAGGTLGDRLRRAGPLPMSDLLRVLLDVTWGLAHAHGRGVVHCDIKPDNILLDSENNRAMVADFGIARAAREALVDGPAIGTPEYMSPEQVTGAPPDTRSDVYSLGATAFAAAVGHPPYDAPNVLALMAKHANDPTPVVSSFRQNLPVGFDGLVEKCLHKDPTQRYQVMEDVATELGVIHGAHRDVPAAVRTLVHEAHSAGGELGSHLAAGSILLAAFELLKAVEGDWFGLVTAIEVTAVIVVISLLLSRLSLFGARIRETLGAGYDYTAFRQALARDRIEQGAPVSPRAGWDDVLVALLGGAVGATGFTLLVGASEWWVNLIGWIGTIGGPMVALRRLAGKGRGKRLWTYLLNKWPGRGLFRLAAVGRGRQSTAAVLREPTVVGLGRRASELFDALPPDLRAQLGDVGGLIAKLQSDAMSMQPSTNAPLDSARFEMAAAALETLRLQLMLHRAGRATLDDLTRDLEAAQKVAEVLDQELEASRTSAPLSRSDSVRGVPPYA